jgi:hypothetical protein
MREKKQIYILVALILSIFIISSNLSVVSAQSYVKEESDEIIYINPLYQDVISKEDIVSDSEEEVTLASTAKVCTTIREAGIELRNEMKERKKTVVIKYKAIEEDYITLLHDIFNEAVTHTGVSTEGDYLERQYAGWSAKYKYSHTDGDIILPVTLIYTITYYTTAAQEKTMDAEVAKVLKSLNLDGCSNYEKVKKIYDYICKNVAYDYTNANNKDNTLKYTGYQALINHKVVCQGYSVLLYRLLLEEGIDNRVILGTSNGGAHSWNIVKLGEHYYNLDPTWDEGRTNYIYFLQCEQNFKDHVRSDEYRTAEFYSLYPMGASDYNGEQCTHSFGEWRVVQKATCVETGIRERECKLCGEIEEKIYIDRTIHEDKTIVNKKTVTCKSEGYTGDTKCVDCGKILKTGKSIKKLNHTYNKGKVTKAPTCLAIGIKTYTCKKCGDKKKETIEKLKAKVTLTTTSITLQVKESKTANYIKSMIKGDYVKSFTSSNKKVVTVSGKKKGTCMIKGLKKGKATITLKFASGITKKITIKVKK